MQIVIIILALICLYQYERRKVAESNYENFLRALGEHDKGLEEYMRNKEKENGKYLY
jgi:hypothetical protein